jgi:peptidoglycan/xylan/chitin deacetylase (PgdA/CDA1 family)
MASFVTLRPDESCEGETRLIKSFLYHRITDDRSAAKLHPLCVHERDFRSQLELLDRWGFTTITLLDYQLFLQEKLHLPKKPIILTLDGSAEEIHRVAFPVLRETGSKAVVFVPAEPAIRSHGWSSEPSRGVTASHASLREMAAEGVEIGSLSLTHQRLTMIPPDEARREIIISKQKLEMMLGVPVISFAYPFGMVNSMVKLMVEEAGYAFACGWSSGPATFGDDPLDIRRISVRTGLGAVGLGLRLHGPFEFYEQIMQKSRAAFARMGSRAVARA